MKQNKTKSYGFEKTTNYDMFHRVVGNRPISVNRIQKLKEVIRKKDLRHENPIKVDYSYGIMDGQHTIAACKELGLPVYYMFTEMSIEDVANFNENRDTWSISDHVISKSDLGRSPYKKILKYVNEWGIQISIIIEIFSLSHRSLRDGTLIFGVATEDKGLDLYEALKVVQKFYDGAFKARFIRALKTARKDDRFDMGVFMKRVKYNTVKLLDCSSTEEYIRIIEKIYNTRTKKEGKISVWNPS